MYVAKFPDNPQHARVVLNEWLGSYIAHRRGLPTTASEILHTSEEVLAESPSLGYTGPSRAFTPYSSGPVFGSRLVGSLMPGKDVFDYLPGALHHNISNSSDFIGALVFDKWVCNMDARQMVFERNATNLYRAYMIDYGHCFGADTWQSTEAPLAGLYGRRRVYETVHSAKAFDAWIELAMRITSDDLWMALRQTPQSWWPNGLNDGLRLVSMLMSRQRRLPEIIWSLRSSHPAIFPAWQ